MRPPMPTLATPVRPCTLFSLPLLRHLDSLPLHSNVEDLGGAMRHIKTPVNHN